MDASHLTEREWALWRAFALMSRQLSGAMEQRLQEEASISMADFEILNALANSPDNQARARDLGEMLTWEKSRISHQVTRMVQRGLVERSECATDLRGTWIRLAPSGTAALERAMPGYSAQLREVFTGVLNGDESVEFAHIALKVIQATDPSTCQVEISKIRATIADNRD